jgi:hypothetical protein
MRRVAFLTCRSSNPAMANRSAEIMKTRQLLAPVILPSLLSGCFTPFIEGATEVYDHAQREQLRPAAASGDPVAACTNLCRTSAQRPAKWRFAPCG